MDKMKALVEYKKKIAFWLDIYPDLVAQKEYADKQPLPTTVSSLKAYTTVQFLPFEELENPFIKRETQNIKTLISTKINYINMSD